MLNLAKNILDKWFDFVRLLQYMCSYICASLGSDRRQASKFSAYNNKKICKYWPQAGHIIKLRAVRLLPGDERRGEAVRGAGDARARRVGEHEARRRLHQEHRPVLLAFTTWGQRLLLVKGKEGLSIKRFALKRIMQSGLV